MASGVSAGCGLVPREEIEGDTGTLFEQLWHPYDEELFEESVQLFARRLDSFGFDKGWFLGKACLDAGCGGGRNTIAMAMLGAAEAQGIDLGAAGIKDAERRAAARGLRNVSFRRASILDIPFDDNRFDLVWCAGVMMITFDAERALDELARVCKPGGKLYLLVYATGGMRWPLITMLRPIAAMIGQDGIERAMAAEGTPANKRRTFLDDLFCPKLRFYDWDHLQQMLDRRGFRDVRRWGDQARLDHEHSLAEYRRDLQSLCDMWATGAEGEFAGDDVRRLFHQGHALTRATIDSISWFEEQVNRGILTEAEAMQAVIGQGHHRLFATKDS